MRPYTTVEGVSTSEFEDRNSRFFGHVAPASCEEEAVEFRHSIMAAIPEASHYVSAYVFHDPAYEHYSDAKEPHGTAGLPVLNVIKGHGVEDVVCVVARIFGGTLLGRGGLMRAYTKAAQMAFETAQLVEVAPCCDTLASFAYPLYEQVKAALVAQGAHIIGTDFADDVTVQYRTLEPAAPVVAAALTELCNGRIELFCDEPALHRIPKI